MRPPSDSSNKTSAASAWQRRYALINDTTPYKHIGCDAVMDAIRRAARERGYTEVASSPVGVHIGRAQYEALLGGADLVVINGEGTLHDDVPACQNLAHFAALSRQQGKRVALLNASYSDNSAITTELFSRCDITSFRDSRSAASFSAHGATSVVGDVSLLSFAPLSRAADAADVYFTDSALREPNRRIAALAGRLGASYAPVKDFWSLLKNRTLRHALRGVFAGNPLRTVIPVASALRNTKRARFERCMKTAGLVITGRYHAVVYCLRNRIPFFYVASNTDKIDWLLEDVGLDPSRRRLEALERILAATRQRRRVIRMSQLDPDEMVKIERYLERQRREAGALLDRVFA